MQAYRHVRVHPVLSAVIAGFSQRQRTEVLDLPALDLPARTDLFLEFYLAEPYGVRRDGATRPAPEIALEAPHTLPGPALLIRGAVDTFTVHFTSTGCHRLYGCDLGALRDRAVLATDALGPGILRLRAALQRAQDFEERVALCSWL
jgi:hypothetical protein